MPNGTFQPQAHQDSIRCPTGCTSRHLHPGYHKDQSGSIVLEMSVVKEGRLIGNVSVKAKSSKEKVVPELLAQALFDGSLDLSY